MDFSDNAIFSEIVSSSSRGLLVLDVSGQDAAILYANPAFAAAAGYAVDELVESSWLEYAAADDEAPELVRLRQALACAEDVTLTLPFMRRDGEIWVGRFQLQSLAHSIEGRRLILVEHLRDERAGGDDTESLKQALGMARRKISSLDRTDAVTGLLSAGEFRLMLKREIAVTRRNRQTLSLILFSVPELEIYRQTFGNNAADSCLRMIAAQIAGTFRRASDLSARIDASTIAVSVHDQDDEQASRLVSQVEKKARSLGLHNPRGRLERYVVVRGAFVSADPASDDADTLIARARGAFEQRDEPPTLSVVGNG